MNLKEGMTVKIQNLPGSRWDGVVCTVQGIDGKKAILLPVKDFTHSYLHVMEAAWERYLKIMNMSMVNK